MSAAEAPRASKSLLAWPIVPLGGAFSLNTTSNKSKFVQLQTCSWWLLAGGHGCIINTCWLASHSLLCPRLWASSGQGLGFNLSFLPNAGVEWMQDAWVDVRMDGWIHEGERNTQKWKENSRRERGPEREGRSKEQLRTLRTSSCIPWLQCMLTYFVHYFLWDPVTGCMLRWHYIWRQSQLFLIQFVAPTLIFLVFLPCSSYHAHGASRLSADASQSLPGITASSQSCSPTFLVGPQGGAQAEGNLGILFLL